VRIIFVGYQDQQSFGWRIYTPDNNKYLITSHAQFENDKYNNSLLVGYDSAANNLNNEVTVRGIENVTATLDTVLSKHNSLPMTSNALSSSSSSSSVVDTLKHKRTNQEDQESLGYDIASSPV